MSYDFSMDRKKIVLAFSILVTLVILIFMAGWVTGIIMSMPESRNHYEYA